ncbi:MAG: hypothetical protein ACOC42_01110, partial [Halobacteriota archaeon]
LTEVSGNGFPGLDLLGDEVPVEGVQSVSQMVGHPHVRARGLVDREEVDRFLPPLRPDDLRRSGGHPPRLGEHTRSSLRRTGMTEDDIARLIEGGVLLDPDVDG